MKRIAFAVVCLLLIQQANAEYCWMIGCKGREGFVMTYITKDGKRESIFRGAAKPAIGSRAELAKFVAMANAPPDIPGEGEYQLGPGFVVEVLEYLRQGEIAHIKVIRDDLK